MTKDVQMLSPYMFSLSPRSVPDISITDHTHLTAHTQTKRTPNMCRIHHLSCPHCLSALIISRRCRHLLARQSRFDELDERLRPEYPSCTFFRLMPGIVRGYTRPKDEAGENEGKCHYCDRAVWYVFPDGVIVDLKWERLSEGTFVVEDERRLVALAEA